MKYFVTVVLALFLVGSKKASGQNAPQPFYVVIGGFSSEANAQRFCIYAHEQNLPAIYAFNEERKVYYVYVRATQKKDIADAIRENLRTGTVFTDAWVFNGVLSGSSPLAKNDPVPAPATPQEEILSPKTEAAPSGPVSEAVVEERSSASVAEDVKVKVEAPHPVGKPFMFRLVNKETGTPVNGLVRLQESDRAQQFRGVNGNEKVYVPAPANRSGKWFVVCHVMGFRPYKKPVVYSQAADAEGASVGDEEEIIIPLVLDRVRRGDYIEMDGVKFYNNAALFTPGSERELDELVAMMEENPDYRIRLHGHTNGNQSRDMVSLGGSTDFFNPHPANAKTHSSARELSLRRAEVVKAYLVSKGIDGERISTKGEGGKQMIFDARGTLAGMNDRVEVEIRKH